MRTTLTIDPDIAAELERLLKERDLTLDQAVNETLRRGLPELCTAPKKSSKQSFTQPVDLGQPLRGNLDGIGEILADLDAEKYG